jgi:hypothetical protein
MMLTMNKNRNCVCNYESTAATETRIESLVRTGLCKDIDAADQEVGCKKGKKGSSQSSGGHKGCNFLYRRRQHRRRQGHKVKIHSRQILPLPFTHHGYILMSSAPFLSNRVSVAQLVRSPSFAIKLLIVLAQGRLFDPRCRQNFHSVL